MSFRRRIFVPVDLSFNSLQAVRVGRDLASVLSEITLFYAIDAEEQKVANFSRLRSSASGSLNGLLVDRVNRLRKIRHTELRDTMLVNLAICVGEDAAEVICNSARRNAADIIVLAAHGRSNHPDRVPGHVAAAVVRGAPCPVMVVRSYGLAAPSGFSKPISPAQSLSSVGALKKTGTIAS
jgi:nucleotide-binding universal stress UspA family protein